MSVSYHPLKPRWTIPSCNAQTSSALALPHHSEPEVLHPWKTVNVVHGFFLSGLHSHQKLSYLIPCQQPRYAVARPIDLQKATVVSRKSLSVFDGRIYTCQILNSFIHCMSSSLWNIYICCLIVKVNLTIALPKRVRQLILLEVTSFSQKKRLSAKWLNLFFSIL